MSIIINLKILTHFLFSGSGPTLVFICSSWLASLYGKSDQATMQLSKYFHLSFLTFYFLFLIAQHFYNVLHFIYLPVLYSFLCSIFLAGLKCNKLPPKRRRKTKKHGRCVWVWSAFIFPYNFTVSKNQQKCMFWKMMLSSLPLCVHKYTNTHSFPSTPYLHLRMYV